MNISELHRIINLITYKPFAGFFISEDPDDMWIQHWQRIPSTAFDNPSDTNRFGPQKGRKWRISAHMTQSEVIQTCLMATIAFEEHEARENFRICGQAVYGPHLDVNALLEIANRKERRNEHRNNWQQESGHRKDTGRGDNGDCPSPTPVDDLATA